MNIRIIQRDEPEKVKGLTVVIDVLRAFTTAAYAFAAGAKEVIVTNDVEEAKSLHASNPETYLMGEIGGKPIEGFHFTNSPVQFKKDQLKGKTLIQRTSCGTCGVVNASSADRILVASFVVAAGTLARIRHFSPKHLTLMVTGVPDGSEDLALADYLQASLMGSTLVPAQYLDRVVHSPLGVRLANSTLAHSPKEDLLAAIQFSCFPFAMEVFMEKGLRCVRPVNERGKRWRQDFM